MYLYVDTYVYIYRMCIHMCIYTTRTHTHIHVHVYVYIYIYTYCIHTPLYMVSARRKLQTGPLAFGVLHMDRFSERNFKSVLYFFQIVPNCTKLCSTCTKMVLEFTLYFSCSLSHSQFVLLESTEVDGVSLKLIPNHPNFFTFFATGRIRLLPIYFCMDA